MHSHDQPDRVHPLEPADATGPTAPRPRFPWIPLLLAGAGLLAVLAAGRTPVDAPAVGASTSDSAVSSSAAPTTAALTTTTTLPRRLDVDGLESGLTAVVYDGTATTVVQWLPSATAPRLLPLADPPGLVTFSTEGTMALLTFEPRIDGSLHVGSGGGPLRTVAVDVTSVAWHDTDPARLAFTATLPFDEGRWLVTADFARLAIRVGAWQRVAAVDEESTIASWGDWGFALNGAEEGVLAEEGRPQVRIPTYELLDATGSAVARADGSVVDAAGSWLLIHRSLDVVGDEGGHRVVAAAETSVVMVDAADPAVETALTFEALRFAGDAERGVGVTVRTRSTEVLVATPRQAQAVRLDVDGDVRLVDVAGDGRFVVLHDVAAIELVVIDLTEGTRHRLPIPPGRVFAVDLR